MPKQQPNGSPGKKPAAGPAAFRAAAAIAKALGIGRASVYRVLVADISEARKRQPAAPASLAVSRMWMDALPGKACAVNKTPSHHRVSPRRTRLPQHRRALWHQAPGLRPAILAPD
jgi:hypothetical protein